MAIRFQNISNKNITTRLGVSQYKYNEATGEQLTPHVLMRKTLDVFERRPFVHQGTLQMVSFISGKGIFAKAKPNVSEEKAQKAIDWMTEWLNLRKKNLEQVKNQLLITYVTQGNSYLEMVFKPGSDELDNVFAVHDSSRVFYNTMSKDDDEFWLFRVGDDVTNIKWRGTEVSTATYQPYKYNPSSVYYSENIRAFRMAKNKLRHLRMPYTMDGFYGFTFMMSVLDDEEAIAKIIRNIITISSNKAVGKKIIGFWNDNGKTIPAEDIEELQDQIDFDVGSNLIVNKKFQVEDLAHTGTYDTMLSEIEYLTKDVGSGLSPSYMTPWNSDVNRATAEQARVPFIVQTEKMKQQVEEFLSETIIGELAKTHSFLNDIELTFGETQYFSREEQKDFFGDLYDRNLITFNQYLSLIGLEPLEGGDIFAREREALLDKRYEELGKESKPYDGVFGKESLAESLGEGIADYYDYEYEEEENHSLNNAKKQRKDLEDEALSVISKEFN